MLTQPRTTFANGINPFGVYNPPTKERPAFVHLSNSKTAQRIKQFINDNPGVPAKEVKEKLAVRGTYAYIRSLEKDGYITVQSIRDDRNMPIKHCYPSQGENHGH